MLDNKVDFKVLANVKAMWTIAQIFVAFSEKLNFISLKTPNVLTYPQTILFWDIVEHTKASWLKNIISQQRQGSK